ncbi:hypothetical protein AS200_44605 (plasmid) [Streptomyces sp. CdTB01]|nr:hypothetical protein AS200_44605 [Streptomyces sp. CdTB01]
MPVFTVAIGLMPSAPLGILGLAAVVAIHEVSEFIVGNGIHIGRAKPLFPAPAPTGRSRRMTNTP